MTERDEALEVLGGRVKCEEHAEWHEPEEGCEQCARALTREFKAVEQSLDSLGKKLEDPPLYVDHTFVQTVWKKR